MGSKIINQEQKNDLLVNFAYDLKWYKNTFEKLPLSIQVFSPDGETIYVNNSWEKLWNLTLSDLQNYNILYDTKLQKNGNLEFIKKGFKGEAVRIPPQRYEVHKKQISNSVENNFVWVEGFIYPTKDDKGNITDIVLVHEDVTLRLNTEDELKRSKDQLEIIFNGVGEGILVQDEKGAVIYSNDTAARFCGYNNAKEFMNSNKGYSLSDFDVFDENNNKFDPQYSPGRRLFKGEKVQDLALCFRNKKTAEEKWTIISASPIKDENGKVILSVCIFHDITKNKEVELDIKKREEKYRVFVENSSEGIWQIELEEPISISLDFKKQITNFNKFGYVAECNNAFAKMYGFNSAKEVLGIKIDELLKSTVKGNVDYLESFIESNYVLNNTETVVRDKENTIRYFSVNLIGIIENGFILRAWGTQIDVTSQKIEEKRHKFLSEASMILSSSLDYKRTLKKVAHLAVPQISDWCAVDIFENEKLNRVALVNLNPEDIKLVHELYEKYPASLSAKRGTPLVFRSGKTEYYPEISDTMLVNSAKDSYHLELLRKIGFQSMMIVPIVARNKVMGTITFNSSISGKIFTQNDLFLAEELGRRAGLAVDNAQLFEESKLEIDRRKVIEKELKTLNDELELRVTQRTKELTELKNRNELILGSAGDGIFGLDLEGKVTFMNLAAEDILGWKSHELIGKELHEIVHYSKPDGSFYDRVDCPIYETLTKGVIHKNDDEFYIRRDGTFFPIEYTQTPIFENKKIIGAVVTIKDISIRKDSEKELQFLNSQLKRSNNELQDFASVASHDLQEPLRKIQTFGERLKLKFSAELPDDGKDYIDRMQNAATRMQILINDLLTFSRVTTKAHPFIKVDLNKLLAEVLNDLEVTIENNKAILILEKLPEIEIDALQMRQLFQNLISNAIKFHKEGECPIVEVKSTISKKDNRCTIYIKDNGIGFDEKYLDRIFNVFQRLHGREEYEGTGIGLAVCRKIVERHNGIITAESIEGNGAVFIVQLPINQTSQS